MILKSLKSQSTKLLLISTLLCTKGVLAATPTVQSEYYPGTQKVSQTSQERSVFLYNESAYLPQYSNLVHEGKMHYHLANQKGFRPYVGFAFGQDLQSTPSVVYNDNHITPLIGLKYNPANLPFGLFSELRENFRLINKPDLKQGNEFDFRLGGYGYKWFDLASLGSGRMLFQESYGEVIFTSMFDQDVILDGWAKQGLRQRLSRIFSFDGYLEFLAGADRLNIDYCNYIYPSLGFRAVAQFAASAIQLMIRRPLDIFSPPSFAKYPWNALLVFTGEF